MATATTQPSISDAATPTTGGLWPFGFAAVSIVLTLAYRLPQYVQSISSREHLQFALLIPVGVVFLAILRQEESGKTKTTAPIHGATWFTAIVLFLAAALCFDSLLSQSVVSWSIALMLTALAGIHFWGGAELFRSVWPLWAFAWLMVPPPFGLDQRLITELQLWVSRLASYSLDSMHVAHVLEGNVIHIEEKKLFVAEACSGINSLFATFVVLVFSMLVLKRSWLHILLLFTMGFLCVLAVNVFRVTSLTLMHYVNPKVGSFFDDGIPHFGFGLLCFALLILLVFSMDSLLWLMGNSIVSALPDRWAKLFSSKPAIGRGDLRTAASTPQQESGWTDGLQEMARRLRASTPRGASWAIAVGVVFCLVSAVQYSSAAYHLARREPAPTNDPDSDPIAPVLGDLSGSLPDDWDGWRRIGEKTEHLNFTNAMFSTSWSYRRGSEDLTIFLHRRYFDFHGLDVCYAGNGWQIKNLQGVNLGADSASLDGEPGMQIISFEMDKEGQGSFVVAFVNYDFRNRRWIEVPPVYRGLDLWGRIELGFRERRNALHTLFSKDKRTAEIAVVLAQRRTIPGAEAEDRQETIDRVVSASKLAFAPLLNPAEKGPNPSPAKRAAANVARP